MEPWFSKSISQQPAELRLFCFPHAGGGTALYHRLGRELPDTIQVLPARLPGREGRLQETPKEDLSELACELVKIMSPLLDRPFALFGHSMGAAIAYEVAVRLREHPPAALFVSACRAPSCENSSRDMHQLPDEAMIAELIRRYGSTDISDDEVALMRMLAGTIRADLKMLETHEYNDNEPVAAPITVLGGAEDGLVTRTELGAWQAETTGRCRVRMFSGGHFYLRDQLPGIAGLIQRELTS